MRDPDFARFFGGRSADSAIRSRQLLVDLGEAERAEFLALFERYRDDIVEAD